MLDVAYCESMCLAIPYPVTTAVLFASPLTCHCVKKTPCSGKY